MNDVKKLVELLCSGQLRVATGLWLLPNIYLGREQDIAVSLGVEGIDLRDRLLASLEPGTKYANISVDQIIRLVDDVSQQSKDWDVALIYNLDLLLSRLNSKDRNDTWQDFTNALPHRHRGILLTLPVTAANLLPPEEIQNQWRIENRLVGTVSDQR